MHLEIQIVEAKDLERPAEISSWLWPALTADMADL